MPAYVFNSGAWRGTDRAWVFNGGAWREAYQIYVYNGANGWRGVWSYAWGVSDWGGCSAGCGGGVQYRSIWCVNNRGAVVDNWKCQWYTGYTLATSQGCNTQACAECRWADPYITGDAYYYTCTNGKWGGNWGGTTNQIKNSDYSSIVYKDGCKYWPGARVTAHPNSYIHNDVSVPYQICRCCPNC